MLVIEANPTPDQDQRIVAGLSAMGENLRPSRLPLAVRWMSLPATFPTQSHVEFEEFDELRKLFGGNGRRVWIGEIGRVELDQRLDS
jgi:hypothetical protein